MRHSSHRSSTSSATIFSTRIATPCAVSDEFTLRYTTLNADQVVLSIQEPDFPDWEEFNNLTLLAWY